MARLLIALFSVFLALATALPGMAQERPRTILVLDGSGSMWGQIDGVNKIVIAREVIGSILQSFPPEQELGLTVYGHRRKGDCTDIETMIAPGVGTSGPITDAVNGINPRGKTPLSAAVIAAAEALKFTEEKATVILVSDGIETCDLDPCAVGRQLEATGVDFTAHVIGFDVSEDPAARAQLQCLAEETGGIFKTASNASELTDALQTVAVAPPAPFAVQFVATEGVGGPRIGDGLVWSFFTEDGGAFSTDTGFAAPTLDLMAGTYSANVVRSEDGAQGTARFTVSEADQVITIALPELVREVNMRFRATEGEGGKAIQSGLSWTVTNGLGIPVLSGDNSASPVLPLLPGEYTVTTVRAEDGAEARESFTVRNKPRTVTLVLPELAREWPVTFVARASGINIGSGLEWTISKSDGTVLFDEAVNAPPVLMLGTGGYHAKVVRTEDGATAESAFGIGSAAHTVVLALPDLPPEPVRVQVYATDGRNGPRIRDTLIWEVIGPDGTVFDAEQAANLDLDLVEGTYTVSVLRPADEATAEERFGVGSVNKTVTLELPEYRPLATLAAPETAPLGSTIQVEWTGPNADSDFITIAALDAAASSYYSYEYTREGPLVDLLMPPEPGTYELRYVLNGPPNKVLATKVIEVTEVETSLALTGDLVAGNTVTVDWTGPDYHNDYIAILFAEGNRYRTYTYTSEGTPLELRLPEEPGDYRLAYVLAQRDTVLETQPITVSDVTASVTGPETAIAGDTIKVDWTGPDYERDYIGVTRRGEDRYVKYSYTRDGAPLDLVMPTEPGDYDLVYFMGQRDRELARTPITVSDVAATLSAPGEAPAGATIVVDWTGPDYTSDYIAVVKPGDDRHITYTYTRNGTPLELVLPNEPGDYELAYIVSQGSTVIAAQPIRVTEVTATVTVPDSGLVAGATVPIDWTGPDYKNDLITVNKRGEDTWINYTYTKEGTPLDLRLPAEPGEYDITYTMSQGRKVLNRVPVTVSAVSASLSAPGTAPVGSEVTVTWTGPDYKNDLIAIIEEGGPEGRWINYSYTSKGSPLTIAMPPEPGRYEIRYVQNQGRLTMASVVIEATGVEATLSAVSEAPVGSELAVDWTGPDYRRDYIAIAPVGMEDRNHATYTYTREGSPLDITLPVEPGEYEIRYVMDANGRNVLARIPVTLTAVEASFDVPASVPAGGTLDVAWTGPDYRNDFIDIAKPGARNGEDNFYTRTGSPGTLDIPTEPGVYELRYFMAQGRTLLHRQEITVE